MTYEDILAFWKALNVKNSDELSVVLDSYRVNFSYHSGKIENDEVTFYDTREIFDADGVTSYTGSTRTLFEIQNAKSAFEKILTAFDEDRPLDETFLKDIHKTLTLGTYDERRFRLGERPGEYKKHDYVTGRNEVGAPPEDVAEEVRELLEDIETAEENIALTAAAFFHAKLENIHPFADGNGRTGRLLMNYILLKLRHPPVIIFEEDRKEYYAALEAYDTESRLDHLTDFLKKQVIKTWENRIR